MAKEKHPRVIRWTHWLNGPLLSLMIWSGLLIYWANDVYPPFFPKAFYKAFHIDHRLAEGMAWHFFLQWFFIANGVVYVAYLLLSGEWRELFPNRSTPKHAWRTMLHDLHLSRKAPPARKFNGMQQLVYTAIILAGVGSALTGYAIYKPVQAGWLRALFGGYDSARFIHFGLTLSYVAFFVLHVVQVARAGWRNLRAMITGSER